MKLAPAKPASLISFDLRVFEAMPSNSMLVQVDAPLYTILAVTEGMIKRSGLSKDQLINKPFFEPFPANPANPDDENSAVQNVVCASFEHVITLKELHSLPLIRYDLPNTEGVFTELYWNIYNKPVLDDKGNVQYILHTSEDITEQVKYRQHEKRVREIEQSHNLFMQAPVAIAILKGEDLIIEMANEPMITLWGRGKSVLDKPIKDALPEIEEQGFIKLLNEVKETGKPFEAYEMPVKLMIDGIEKLGYYTFTYQPYYEEDKTKAVGILIFATEVTEQVHIEKKILETEQQFRNVVEQSDYAISILKGKDLIIEVANKPLLRIWNKGSEVIGQPVKDTIPEAEEQGFLALLSDVYHNGKTHYGYEAPAIMQRSSGKPVTLYFDFVYQPYREQDGTISGVLVLANDITDRVNTKKELAQKNQRLKESSEKFSNLLEALPQMTWTNLPTGEVNFYNQQWYNYTGLTYEQTKDWGWKAVVHADDLPRTIKHYTEALLTRNVFETENRFKGADGNYRWHLNRALPIKNEKEEIILWVGTATDIHDLKNIENVLQENSQNLRNIITKAPVAMCILREPEYIVEIANERMFELWGKSSEAVLNKPVFESIPEAREQGLEALLLHVYTTGETFIASERPVDLFRKGRMETVYLNFVYEPFYENESIAGIIAVAVDVTEQVLARHKIEEVVAQRTKEVAETNLQLQQTNIELNQFAYIASHDLQEPLRKVRTFAQLMEQNLGEVSEKSKTYLDKIQVSITRMQTLINDVLKFSLLSKEREKFKSVDLNKTLINVLGDYELAIEQKGAKITAEVLPVVEAISLQMDQLFTNLLSNALKFSSNERQLEIIISSKRLLKAEVQQHPELNEDTVYHLIEFTDNGIGFNQEHAQQIFTIFQRLHGRMDYAGTGIGLAMCKRITANHHGIIYAEARVNEGATFIIILPEILRNADVLSGEL